MEIIVFTSSMFSSLAAVSFVAFSNLAYATIYDFGNIQTVQSEPPNYSAGYTYSSF